MMCVKSKASHAPVSTLGCWTQAMPNADPLHGNLKLQVRAAGFCQSHIF